MACEANGSKVGEIIKQLCDEGFEGLTGAVITLLNEVMKLDRGRHLQARPYERNEERQAYISHQKLIEKYILCFLITLI
jgi:hypothetical protein